MNTVDVVGKVTRQLMYHHTAQHWNLIHLLVSLRDSWELNLLRSSHGCYTMDYWFAKAKNARVNVATYSKIFNLLVLLCQIIVMFKEESISCSFKLKHFEKCGSKSSTITEWYFSTYRVRERKWEKLDWKLWTIIKSTILGIFSWNLNWALVHAKSWKWNYNFCFNPKGYFKLLPAVRVGPQNGAIF